MPRRTLGGDPPEHEEDGMALRLTVTGTAGHWRSALRDGRTTVADCGHHHRNRDTGQGAARTCGAILMSAARSDRDAERFVAADVQSAARARSLGAQWSDDQARAKAEERVATWRTAVLAEDFHSAPTWAQRNVGATCGCCLVGSH
jgi:hypothetical protein